MKKKIGIILGSGLSNYSDELTSPVLISQDGNSFHKLKTIAGKIKNKEVVIFSGRRHYYEGYSPGLMLRNIDIASDLGLTDLIITNAAGGLNKNFRVSDLMFITSHLNFINNCYPSQPNKILYPHENLILIKKIASEEQINLRYGNYCSNTGPMYETGSEIRFLKKFGIDAVGMSTVPEILYANKLGINTISFSCITNILSEDTSKETSHDEVVEAGKMAYANFSRLLNSIILKSE